VRLQGLGGPSIPCTPFENPKRGLADELIESLT
jgi:hypothetical protein